MAEGRNAKHYVRDPLLSRACDPKGALMAPLSSFVIGRNLKKQLAAANVSIANPKLYFHLKTSLANASKPLAI
jgi:hypothetical protein